MHDYSIKLLAVEEGPRGDDASRADDRIRCMTELTDGLKRHKEEGTYLKKKDDILLFIGLKLRSVATECMESFYVVCDPPPFVLRLHLT